MSNARDLSDIRLPLSVAKGGTGGSYWSMLPIGMPIPLFTHLTGVTAPPTNSSDFRYIKLSSGDSYNTGVLGSESVTGTGALVLATGVITLAGSPLNGQTVQLINTEARSIRAGITAGTLLQDAIQNITGSIGAFFRATGLAGTGALGATQYGTTPPKAGVQGADPGDSATITFNASNSVRTDTETRVKSINAVYYMRIK